jgi:hypothetical protein
MAEEASASSVSATANILFTEAVVDVLRRKGVLDVDDIRRAFIIASSEAARLGSSDGSRYKVLEVLDAMESRARRRMRARGEEVAEPPR